MTILIVGIGNPWASDDGVGPQVAQRLGDRLRASTPPTCQVEVKLFPQPGPGLLDALEGCAAAFIANAAFGGAPAGTEHRMRWQPGNLASRGVERALCHGFGLREVPELGAALARTRTR